MTILTLLGWFILGLVLLVGGAELLVRGAQRISLMLGISPLIVGLTIVAFGTSAPEVAVSVEAALKGSADLVIGNIVGSNISNILLVLGFSAALSPMVVSRKLVRVDVPIMIGITIIMYMMSLNGMVGLTESIVLLLLLIGYILFLVIHERRERAEKVDEDEVIITTSFQSYALNALIFIAGLFLLVKGSGFLVDSAVELATFLGLSELIIGLTIVSIGTSLPELATSVVASMKGERNLAVGNIVGSNIFNLLLVLGVTGIASGEGVAVPESAINFDILVMLAVSIACLPIFYRGYGLQRWEGWVFLAYYAAYITYLVLASVGYPNILVFENAMAYFAIPITSLTFLTLAFIWLKGRKNKDVPDV